MWNNRLWSYPMKKRIVSFDPPLDALLAVTSPLNCDEAAAAPRRPAARWTLAPSAARRARPWRAETGPAGSLQAEGFGTGAGHW